MLLATDGRNALRVIDDFDGCIDLLLTDVVMPHMSGPELASAIQMRCPQTRVLFMSGYTDDAVVRHGLLQANVAFIQKPYSAADLAHKVRHVLDEQSSAVLSHELIFQTPPGD